MVEALYGGVRLGSPSLINNGIKLELFLGGWDEQQHCGWLNHEGRGIALDLFIARGEFLICLECFLGIFFSDD